MEATPITRKLPAKFSEVVRTMKVGQSLDITTKKRSSIYSHAKLAFPEASFTTRQIGNKIYLYRTA